MAKKIEKEKKVSKAPKKGEDRTKVSVKKNVQKTNSKPSAKPNTQKEDKLLKKKKNTEKEKISKKPSEKTKMAEKKKKEKVTIDKQAEALKKEKKIIEEEAPKKRGRKRKSDSANKEVVKKIDVIKLKSKKPSSKKGKASGDLEDTEETFDELEDLNLDFEDEIDALAPVKRKPGRPAKPKDQIASKLIDFPSSIRLPKRQSTKPKKALSQTIPGSGLAQLLASGDIKNLSENSNLVGEELKTDIIDIQEEAQSLPSWTPRSWVTREGERLIIRGQELVKEEQFGNLDAEAPPGVISPDEVDEVIRRIRESYKKKSLPKKGN